ncbi:MAG TPA: hypothetical protein P5538_00890 [Bacteroidales bacterium]|nr:hypothetical protein [Bacteroidales bacterium]HOL97782.1 hypothetical protein [Bacteroidales bacterium]HOM35831.1 hypothetical protein [Bacteroidales bacterium]HPD23249.1 hypothetical protein [Bacteroidales bacterium]HRS99253.1 hypothetical protein [Bacteroidales bacterium]
MKRFSIKILLVFFVALVSFEALAQLKPDVKLRPEEDAILRKSLTQFKDKDYYEAYKGFSQLLSVYPVEPVFNFYYGACFVLIDENLQNARKYLEYAAGKGIYQAKFFIGLSYHNEYEFEKALVFYEEFKNSAKRSEIKEYDLDRFIRIANNGIELINYAYNLKVISTKKVNENNFYYSYNLKDFEGDIIIKTPEFKSKLDSRIKHADLMYISERHNVLFYSSYGENTKTGLDIYVSQKINDQWTPGIKLPAEINTEYDEAFPFLSEDGLTLYFSSKGHNSMGGYDIFKSDFDPKTNTWTQAVNLDFPINTPYDEIMFAVDSFYETAFFSSKRETRPGQINVYRILYEANPEKRKLENLSQVKKTATLEINPLAINELNTRQEIRAKNNFNIKPEETPDTIQTKAFDKELALVKTDELINNKQNIAFEYKKLASSSFELTKNKIQEIKSLNNELNELKKQQDQKSNQRRIEIENLIQNLYQEIDLLYNLSIFFNDKAVQTTALLQHYKDELKILENTQNKDPNFEKRLNELNQKVNLISSENPFELYSKNLDEDIRVKQGNLNKYKVENDALLNLLNDLDERIETKLNLAKNEKDYYLREKYINDVKMHENDKLDLIPKIKQNIVQQEFLNFDIKQINLSKEKIKKIALEIEENPIVIENLNIKSIVNDVEIIRTAANQNYLKQLSLIQEKIMADTKYFSPKRDLDAILHESSEDTQELLSSFSETAVNEYGIYASEKTTQIFKAAQTTDSLKIIVKIKETEFDNTNDPATKNEIIKELNLINQEIKKNEQIIAQASAPKTSKSDIHKINENINATDNISNKPEKLNIILAETKNLIQIYDSLQVDLNIINIYDPNLSTPQAKIYLSLINDVETKLEDLNSQLIAIIENKEIIASKPDYTSTLSKISLNYQQIINQYKNYYPELKTLAENIINEADDERANQFINQYNNLKLQTIAQFFATAEDIFSKFEKDYLIITNEIIEKDDKLKNSPEARQIKAAKSEYDFVLDKTMQNNPDNVKLKNIEEALIELQSLMMLIHKNLSEKIEISEVFNNNTIEFISAISQNITEFSDLPSFKFRNIFVQVTNEIKPQNIQKIITETLDLKIKSDNIHTELQSTQLNASEEKLNELIKTNNDIAENLKRIKTEIATLQYQTINSNKSHPNVEELNISSEIDDFFTLYNKVFNEGQFYMIDEVIISGEKVINKQNKVLPVITLIDYQADKVIELQRIYEQNNNFINSRQAEIIAYKDYINKQNQTGIDTLIIVSYETQYSPKDSSDNLMQTQTTFQDTVINDRLGISQNRIVDTGNKPENMEQIINIETQDDTVQHNDTITTEILLTENLSETNTSQEDTIKITNITENPGINNINTNIVKTEKQNVFSDTLITQEQNLINKNTDIINDHEINDTISKIIQPVRITDDSKISELNKYFDQIKDDIQSLQNKRKKIENELANTNNRRKQVKLSQEIAIVDRQIVEEIKKLSQGKINLIVELEKTITATSDPLISKLKTEHSELRNSIIYYSNFYSIDEIAEKNERANLLENEILNYYYQHRLDTLIAEQTQQPVSSDSSEYQNPLEKISIIYNIEPNNIRRLDYLETKIINYDNQIEDLLTKNKSLEKNAAYAKTFKEFKKIQKQIDKNNKQMIKTAKLDAKLKSEFLSLKYDIYSNYYQQNSSGITGDISYVGDSLKKLSYEDYLESLSSFEVIVTYKGKSANTQTINKFLEADSLANNSLKLLHKSNMIITINNEQHPEIIAYQNLKNKNLFDETTNLATTTNNYAVNRDTVLSETIITSDTVSTKTSTEELAAKIELDFNASDRNATYLIPCEDLCYKIQIGAFYQELTSDKLPSVSPIYIEKVPESRLLRYLVGHFLKYPNAVKSLPKVRNLGFNDAFIVAYYKGKRIPIYEARQLEEQTPLIAENKNIHQQNTEINPENRELSTQNFTSNYNVDLKSTTGIFYCVQIGVFRNRVSSERLFNLHPIMFDEYKPGLVRHTFGKYYSLQKAIEEQNKIRALGIPDAFVIAYKDGEKIDLNTAGKLLALENNLPQDEILVNLDVKPQNIPQNPVQNQVNQQQSGQAAETNQTLSKPEYYIQIGVFSKELNTFIVDNFRKIAGNSQLISIKQNNLTIYRIGKFNKYSDAQNKLTEVRQSGIKDAFVIALIDGKRVALNIARNIE